MDNLLLVIFLTFILGYVCQIMKNMCGQQLLKVYGKYYKQLMAWNVTNGYGCGGELLIIIILRAMIINV